MIAIIASSRFREASTYIRAASSSRQSKRRILTVSSSTLSSLFWPGNGALDFGVLPLWNLKLLQFRPRLRLGGKVALEIRNKTIRSHGIFPNHGAYEREALVEFFWLYHSKLPQKKICSQTSRDCPSNSIPRLGASGTKPHSSSCLACIISSMSRRGSFICGTTFPLP